MVTDKVSYNECTGCSACVNICPKKIIKLKSSNDGFEIPFLNRAECIQCGLCEVVCPCLSSFGKINHFDKKGFAVWSLNSVIRGYSASGGVFAELAKQTISQGGRVIGAKFDDNNMIIHYMISMLDDITKLQQSKYVQSKKGTVFTEIKRELDEGMTVLFSGTPCEVAGLKSFLRRDYANLFTCDFICKGAASPKAYNEYLKELEEKYKSKISLVWFKEKSRGWNNFSTKVIFENGSVYKKDRYHDWYIRGYAEENLFLRRSCSVCKFKGDNRFSDITLADFWGAGKIKRKLDYDLGTSLIITNTAKGESMLNSISDKVFIEPVSLNSALKGNCMYYNSAISSVDRDNFFSDLGKKPFSKVVKKYVYKGCLVEMKREIRNKAHWFVRKGLIFFDKLRK